MDAVQCGTEGDAMKPSANGKFHTPPRDWSGWLAVADFASVLLWRGAVVVLLYLIWRAMRDLNGTVETIRLLAL